MVCFLQFMSFLRSEMVQVVEIIFRGKQAYFIFFL